jgi:diaminopimelate epimerase
VKKKPRAKKSREKLEFVKAEATGNDFVIFDLRDPGTKKLWPKKLLAAELVEKICDRNFGIGADGVVLLLPPKNKANTLAWKFYNADGSEAEMCGNASRCVALYEKKYGKSKPPYKMETLSGVVVLEPEPKGRWSSSKLPPTKVLCEEIQVKGDKKTWRGVFINSGVPHFVVETDSFTNREQLEVEARAIKLDKKFGKAGTNVTFLCRHDGYNFVVTHERGVEDFTLSCGTGAVAVARYLADKYDMKRGSRLELPGGAIEVNLGKYVELVGPAKLVFRGTYEL